jgi:MinD superfamily P-loop ATPase
MKEIAIISGKGGTGKTSITAALAYLAKGETIIADCDVDAADMHLLLKPDFANSEDFYSGKIAQINYNKCIQCGECKAVCQFDAIQINAGAFEISEINCEGCGYCANICPVDAIDMKDNLTGEFYISKTRLNTFLVHAELRIGAENSGKLVSKVRKEAKQLATKLNVPFVIIDGTPGIGCPVTASITGADYVVIVTEPTVSGIHDLRRVYELVKRFGISAGCIINKADLNEEVAFQIKSFLKSNNIELITELPYDNVFTKAVTSGITVMENDSSQVIKSRLTESWAKIK